MKRSVLIAIGIVFVCLLLLSWRFRNSASIAVLKTPLARSTSTPAQSLAPTGINIPRTSSEGSDSMAKLDRPRFAAPAASAQKRAGENDIVLQNAQSGIRNYRREFHQNPVGTNAEITRILLGKNPRSARYLPETTKLDDKGQLLDRWAQPLFFHQISATVMEVRSAGPDHVMWTNDDEVLR